jgi:hypothetical protein
MTRRARPRVIDFSRTANSEEEQQAHDEYQEILTAIRGGRPGIQTPCEVPGPTTFTLDTDGKLRYHTKPVPAFRMRRARRILWECQQHPDWPYRPSMFFRHPALRNVPYPVLKRLVQESEGTDARK